MFTDARTFTSLVHLRHSYIYVSLQAHTDSTKSVTHHSHLQILAYVHTETCTCTHWLTRHTDSLCRHLDLPYRHIDSPYRHTDSPRRHTELTIQTYWLTMNIDSPCGHWLNRHTESSCRYTDSPCKLLTDTRWLTKYWHTESQCRHIDSPWRHTESPDTLTYWHTLTDQTLIH